MICGCIAIPVDDLVRLSLFVVSLKLVVKSQFVHHGFLVEASINYQITKIRSSSFSLRRVHRLQGRAFIAFSITLI